jgi:pilus assembly protein Flp/PilA
MSFVSLLLDESGAGVLEYGVVLALVAMVVVAAMLMIGNNSNSSLNHSASSFPSGAPGIDPRP